MNKSQLRNKIIKVRENLTKDQHNILSNMIIDHICNSSFYKEAKTIMTFVSFGSEVNTHDFIKQAIKDGKNILVPITVPETKELKVSRLLDFKELEIGYYNILSPKEEFLRFIDPEEIDLVIVPGVAFDKTGHRIGYGGGYYDRFLSKRRKDLVTIAIAFDLQLISQVPTDKYDIQVKFLVTENGFIDIFH